MCNWRPFEACYTGQRAPPATSSATRCLGQSSKLYLDTKLRRSYINMSGWGLGSWFGGSTSQKKKDAPKEAILQLRSTLEMLTKREKHYENLIDEQDAIARKNVSTNKNGTYKISCKSHLHQLRRQGIWWHVSSYCLSPVNHYGAALLCRQQTQTAPAICRLLTLYFQR